MNCQGSPLAPLQKGANQSGICNSMEQPVSRLPLALEINLKVGVVFPCKNHAEALKNVTAFQA